MSFIVEKITFIFDTVFRYLPSFRTVLRYWVPPNVPLLCRKLIGLIFCVAVKWSLPAIYTSESGLPWELSIYKTEVNIVRH